MNPTEASILTGFKRLINSAKIQATTVSIAGMWMAAHFAAPTLDPQQRGWLWVSFISGVAVLVRECVNAWGAEDAAKASSAPTSPAVQVNTGATATNEQSSTAPATSPSNTMPPRVIHLPPK